MNDKLPWTLTPDGKIPKVTCTRTFMLLTCTNGWDWEEFWRGSSLQESYKIRDALRIRLRASHILHVELVPEQQP